MSYKHFFYVQMATSNLGLNKRLDLGFFYNNIVEASWRLFILRAVVGQ